MSIQGFRKKILSAALCLCMALSLLPTAAFADTGVAYLDDKGVEQTCTTYTTVTTSTAWGVANTTTWYVLSGDVTVGHRITVSGTVNFILTDDCTLTATNGGINVGSGQALTIYGQTAGTGAIKATGGKLEAGIGGGDNENGGTITINGGTVTATGGKSESSIGGAGIGGGHGGSGIVTINGGTVTATGDGGSAGIGGGFGGSGGTITISGGSVTAIGGIGKTGIESAGIGGGYYGSGGTVTINGGTVMATGGGDAGIGGGAGNYVGKVTVNGGMVTANGGIKGDAITVNGGTVIATGDSNCAGIGGGDNENGSTITINGGTVTATGDGGSAGIGGGYRGSGGTITINGGSVTATGSSSDEEGGAGIGGGYIGSGGTITINGGTVTANGGSSSAGIGGGQNGSGGEITINGGSVTANGRVGGAGIGGGYSGGAGTITINGGTVTATSRGGYGGAGIGSGDSCTGAGGSVTVTGGDVQATGGKQKTWIGAGIGEGDGSSAVTVTVKPAAGRTISVKTSTSSMSAVAVVSGSPFTNPTVFNYSSATTANNQYAVLNTSGKLNTPLNLIWGSGTNAGTASWGAVTNASSYSVQLYKGSVAEGNTVGAAQSVTGGTSFGFALAITTEGTGSYFFTVTAVGNGTTYANSDSATSAAYHYTAPGFVPVTKITMTNAATIDINTDLTFAGTVVPDNAINQTIVWSVSTADAGTTGATVSSSGVFKATAAGTATVTATIANGTAQGTPYTQDFTITVTDTPATTYTITYNANGGSGTMTNGTATADTPFTIPSCTFTAPTGQQFKEWAIGSTTGTKVAANGTHTFTAATTVYAVWEDIPAATYTVTINLTLDGSTYTGQTVTMQEGSGTVYPLTEGTSGAYTNTAVPNGTYTIYQGGVSTGKTVAINGANGSATLDFFTVSFAPNGGTPAPASQFVIKDGYAAAPAAMTYGTMALSGWYASSMFAGSAWSFATNAVTATTTLYAKWTSGDKAIMAYSINGVNGTIDEMAGTIAVTLPAGTNVTALAASFTASANAVVTVGGTAQVSGTTANDFTSAVTYTVTAQNNTTKTYVVTVTVAAAPAALAYTDSATYDVPASTVSTAITPINVSPGVSGGTKPYIFSLESAPSWLSINSSTGVITGTRPATAAAATTATVKVTDSASSAASKTITIDIGAVTAAPPTTYNLVSISTPADVTGIANGTALTSITLPTTVTINSGTGGPTSASVTWDLKALSITYDPATETEQTFSIPGTVTLPDNVTNTSSVSLNVSVSVTVAEKSVVTVTGVAVKTQPTKTTYTEGDALDLSGLEVTLNYSNGSTKDVALVDFGANGVTANPANGATLSTVGAINVVITVGNATVNIPITVNTAPVTPTIAFTTQPASSTSVTAGSITGSLTAAASVTPSGEATLNWFACDSSGTLSGSSLGTSGTFAIPTTLTAGTYYYLCQATYSGAATVNSNVATVTVSDAPATAYTISVSADPTAGGTATGGGTYNKNDSVTVAVTANSGYHFVKWTEGGTQVSTSASYTFSVTADRTLVAVFEADTPTPPTTYTVTVNGSYAATTGAGNYAQGDTVYIYAGTRSDYSFSGWTVVSGSASIINAERRNASFTMPGNAVTVKANWTYNGGGITYTYYTITATAGEGGSISPSGSVSVREGLDKAFTITPKDGYVIDDVTVDGVSVKKQIVSYTYTFENVQKSHTIKATFIEESKVNPDTGVDNPFTDVKDTDWFFKDVMFVYDRGLMVGTSDTTFSPYSTTTRAMVATTIWRMEGKPTPSGSNPFADVESGKYYTDAVTWAKENSIVAGYSATSFGPNDPVTREQLAMFFYNYAKYKGYDTGITGSLDKFTDKGDVSDWAQDAMQWAVGYGLIQGKTDNTLDPKGNATRAEFAAMLHRFIEKNELVEGVTTTGLMGWIDPKRLGIPNTGDTASSAWPFVMFASLAAFAVLILQNKRREDAQGGMAEA